MAHNIRFGVLILVAALSTPAGAQWTASGRDAIFTMYLPQARMPDTNVLFIVSYEKRFKCRPAVSVLLMTGRKLGAPERQFTERKRKDQLSINVDGRQFTAETKITKYASGMEFAMFAPGGLIEALKSNPKTLQARIGAGMGGFDFSDGTGFNAANADAQKNCS